MSNVDDKQLITDVRRAREFLRAHFPESNQGDILDMVWIVEYPDVDRAIATPVVLGHKVYLSSALYHLTWTDRGLVWESEGLALRNALGLSNPVVSIRVLD